MQIRYLLAAALLAGCAQSRSGSLVFGAAGPWDDPNGLMNKRGIELAVDDVNAQPAWRAHPLRIVYRNDAADGVKATQIAKEFLDSASICAVVGHMNSGAMVSAAKIYDHGLPAVATSASSPNLSGISRWTFRVISSDSMNGVDIGRFVTRLGRRRAAILYENNAYGRGIADAFRRGFDGDVVDMDPIADVADQDFEPYMNWFAVVKPDVIFIGSTIKPGVAFLRQARQHHLAADLAAGDGWTAIVSDSADAEGVYIGAPFSAEDARPEAQQFVRAFRQRYGVTPDGHAALAYDATRLLAQAAEHAGGNRVAIRDYLAHLGAGAFRGVTGAVRFNDAGDPVDKSIVMTRVHDGTLVVSANEGGR